MAAPIRTIADWSPKGDFDSVIDVRSPSEFADDHIPIALNLPVLSDRERDEVGKIYKANSFDGRKFGAQLVTKNIAEHLKNDFFASLSPSWKPLIYCWRGGQRSRAMATIFSEIGWSVTVLEGGYKTYRRQVREGLDALIPSMRLVLLQGVTGSAKTRILRAAGEQAQVIDLEGLAGHRGSILGAEPDIKQPSQCYFETLLYDCLAKFDLRRPILVEAESSRIGACHLPRPLWQRMREAPHIRIEADIKTRIKFLKRDYAHILKEPSAIDNLIEGMATRYSKSVRENWQKLKAAGDWDNLIAALINDHYDPTYSHASSLHKGKSLGEIHANSLTENDFASLAKQVIARMQN